MSSLMWALQQSPGRRLLPYGWMDCAFAACCTQELLTQGIPFFRSGLLPAPLHLFSPASSPSSQLSPTLSIGDRSQVLSSVQPDLGIAVAARFPRSCRLQLLLVLHC